MRFLDVLGTLARIFTMLGAVALAVMMICTTYDVIARAAFGQPLHGVVDITEIMVLGVALLGLPEVCLRDEQIRVDILDDLVPATLLKGLKLLGVTATITFLALLLANIVRPMLDAYRFGDIKADTGFPVYLSFALIFICLLAAALTTLTGLARLVGANRSERP
ncbi:TRAP transporter small permease [Pseudolabrys taiwanensis]|uniref:TRAP transporter small permease protein n=1 Tax=Pseudolabrys taiwanensis TaxID=331696 RepID=A0A345ZWW1_9HYPH|nr:TRAP transporter small permease subunit [Pseudolabrys taiwanensis]AXK81408.1 TRAP transporter small permease [Pseudolabrys taiwanensis]